MGRIAATAPMSKLSGRLWLALAGLLMALWLSVVCSREVGRKGEPARCASAGANGRRLLGSAGLDESQRVELLQGTEWRSAPSSTLAADVSFRVGALGMAPAWRIITGHRGQGPDLALSGSPNLDSTCERKSLPTEEPPASSSSCPSRPPIAAVQLPSSPPAMLPCQPAQGPANKTCQAQARPGQSVPGSAAVESPSSCPGQGVPGLPPGRQRPAGLVGRRHVVRPASRSRSDPGHPHTLMMKSSSQHIQEVSRRARWSHLANESSISTSKGPPPAPAKARLDAMLLLGPCLFPSPPPCPHTFSLTTNC